MSSIDDSIGGFRAGFCRKVITIILGESRRGGEIDSSRESGFVAPVVVVVVVVVVAAAAAAVVVVVVVVVEEREGVRVGQGKAAAGKIIVII